MKVLKVNLVVADDFHGPVIVFFPQMAIRKQSNVQQRKSLSINVPSSGMIELPNIALADASMEISAHYASGEQIPYGELLSVADDKTVAVWDICTDNEVKLTCFFGTREDLARYRATTGSSQYDAIAVPAEREK